MLIGDNRLKPCFDRLADLIERENAQSCGSGDFSYITVDATIALSNHLNIDILNVLS